MDLFIQLILYSFINTCSYFIVQETKQIQIFTENMVKFKEKDHKHNKAKIKQHPMDCAKKNKVTVKLTKLDGQTIC